MKTVKKLLIIVPVICAIALFAALKMNKKPPVRVENRERTQTVRVIPMEKTRVIPQVVSYGYVEPERTWQAIPEVSGKVVYMNEGLKKGHFIKAGEVLLSIDTTAYGLAESRSRADLMNVDARLIELEQQKTNTQRLLTIEKQSLKSAGQELKRKQELFSNGYISASDLEKEERTFLAHQTSVNNLQNALDLIPSQKKALLAQKKSGESTVSQQQLDVEKTQIRAPFNCRLSTVNIELYQFAAAGSVLVEAISVDTAEIPVPLTPKNLFTLLPREHNGRIGKTPDMEMIRKAMGISAKVRLPLDANQTFEWEGRFSRTSESMDTQTGTLIAYITVNKPYENAIPGKRPPLVANMYVEVILSGRPIADRFVIPRSAIHDGQVYIADRENRLEIRPVDVEFFMKDIAVLSNGFSSGEKLILTDLVPAVDGMLLNPQADPDKKAALTRQALGEDR
jgi:multidrug efflux system membrane fusion protein